MAPASNSTMHKVLNTTELLESILLHADTKTLLACLQVSKRLNKVIRKSPALLQHNFLAPITKASELSAQSSVTNEFVIERKILVCAQRCCWFKIHRAHNHVGKKTDSEYGVTFFHSYCSEQSRARQSWQVMLLEQPPRKVCTSRHWTLNIEPRASSLDSG